MALIKKHPAAFLVMDKRVVVAGGGLAGIAAAAALAEQGASVTLIERRKVLGGRASAFPVEGGWLDNCQHVILGSNVKLLALLEKLGSRRLVGFTSDIPFLSNGKTTLIRPSWLPVPLHFLPSFLKAPLFSPGEKFSILKLFTSLHLRDPNDPGLDEISLSTWLRGQGQSAHVIQNFWNIIFVSSLNESLDRTSAKYGVMVLRETFLKDRDSARFGTPNVSLSELYHEAAQTLFKNARVTLIQSGIQAFVFDEATPKVVLEHGEQMSGDAVVSALPFYNLLPLLPERIRALPPFSGLLHLETSPILGIHLWFDRKLTELNFGAFCGSPIHWFFSKPAAQNETYIQLVISACRDYMQSSTDELIQLGLGELKKYLPKAQTSKLLRFKVVREARATFSPKPGCDEWRPDQRTPIPGFYLAGDWTQTGWPATMEGAVRSGLRAAEIMLEDLVEPSRRPTA